MRLVVPLLFVVMFAERSPFAVQAEETQLRTPSNGAEQVTLREWRRDGSLEVELKGGTHVVANEDWIELGKRRESLGATEIYLVDGSTLVGHIDQIDEDTVVIRMEIAGLAPRQTLKREHILGGELRAPSNSKHRDSIRAWMNRKAGSVLNDVLLLERNEEASGRIRRLFARAEANDAKQTWQIELTNGSQTSIPSDEVVAFRFRDTKSKAASKARVGMGLEDGSWLEVADMDDTDLILKCGWKIQRDANVGKAIWKSVCCLIRRGPGVECLSDLEPKASKQIPLVGESEKINLNRGSRGGLLRSIDRVSSQGIQSRGTSRFVYDVPPDAEWLIAEAGLEEGEPEQGSMRFRVFLQGKDLEWTEPQPGPLARAEDPSTWIQIRVTGAIRIALVSETTADGDVGDSAIWHEPRFLLAPGKRSP